MRYTNKCLLSTAIFAVVSAATFGGQLFSQEINPSPRVDHKTMINADALRGLNGSGTAGNGIFYHGGQVMLGTPNVYLIWYGSWVPSSKLILTNLVSSLSASPYLKINSTYYDGANNIVTGNVALAGQTSDNYSLGKNLSDAQIQQIVSNSIVPSGSLPLDPQGVYFVMTWTDVTATSGFCTQYCGWHTEATIKGQPIKYSFVGNAAVKCPNGCIAQGASPNNDKGADGAASVLTHELEETMTDPNLNAWYDNSGNENADKCAWTFGTMYTTSNGAKANVNLGGLDYLIQQNWVNAAGGFCAMSYNNTAPVLSSVTPNTGAQGGIVNVTLAGSNFIAGSTVAVSGSGVTPGAVTVVSATQITAAFTIAAAAATGAHNVSVTSANGTSGAVTFNVTGTPPTLTSVSPNSGSQGASVNVTLTGTNFVSGATVAVAGSGVTSSSVTVVSPTQITATLALAANATVGAHNVTIGTSAGTSNTAVFNVTAGATAPTLSSVAPNSGAPGTSVNVTLTGTNFVAGATVAVSGSGVTASGVTVVSATQITASVTIGASAAAGAHNLTVTTGAGTSGAVPFTVTGSSLAPVLTSITPNNGTLGTPVNVTLIGANFTPQTRVRLAGLGASQSNVVVVSSTQITFTVTLTNLGGPGVHNVSVYNSAGTSNILPFTAN